MVADECVRDRLDGVHDEREGHVEPEGEAARREGLCGEERAQGLHHQRQPHEHLVRVRVGLAMALLMHGAVVIVRLPRLRAEAIGPADRTLLDQVAVVPQPRLRPPG